MAAPQNGLDPDVWGKLSEYDLVPFPQTEFEMALEFLGKAQELLWDLCEGVDIPRCRVEFLQTEIALAANHFGWWMPEQGE